MKKSTLAYWIVTVLFAGFMLLTAIPDVVSAKDAIKMITGLGYPTYFIPFIGVAKVLGAVVVLTPGFKSLKEWAYAGLFFDLLAATYSIIQTSGIQPQVSFMLLPIIFLFLSYYLWHKKMKNETLGATAV